MNMVESSDFPFFLFSSLFCWWWGEVSFLDKSQSYSCIVCHFNFVSLSHKLEFWLEYSRLKCLLSGWFYSNPTTPHSTSTSFLVPTCPFGSSWKEWVVFLGFSLWVGALEGIRKRQCLGIRKASEEHIAISEKLGQLSLKQMVLYPEFTLESPGELFKIPLPRPAPSQSH